MIYLGIGIGIAAVIAVLVWVGIKAMNLVFDLSDVDFSDDDEKN